jgi:hypothetical protein
MNRILTRRLEYSLNGELLSPSCVSFLTLSILLILSENRSLTARLRLREYGYDDNAA